MKTTNILGKLPVALVFLIALRAGIVEELWRRDLVANMIGHWLVDSVSTATR